jgi:hypothetical protein
MSRFLAQESTVTASCYTVESATARVHGFHYCTTLGAGESKTSSLFLPIAIMFSFHVRHPPILTSPFSLF